MRLKISWIRRGRRRKRRGRREKRKKREKGEEENSRSFVIWSAILGAPSVCCIHVGLDVQ